MLTVGMVYDDLSRMPLTDVQLMRLAARAFDRGLWNAGRRLKLLADARLEIDAEEDEYITASIQGTAPGEDARDKALQARIRHAVSGWASL